MKKILVVALAALLTISLAACGTGDSGKTTTAKDTTTAPNDTGSSASGESTTDPSVQQTDPKSDNEVFYFEADGVKMVPGTVFDPSGLPEVEPYTVPSCAFDGSDVIYTYDTFEVTANDLPEGQIIYSVYILDPNVTTPEGLALGDDAARVTALYGEDCESAGGQLTYRKGDTLLIVTLQNDTVFSIEYRSAE